MNFATHSQPSSYRLAFPWSEPRSPRTSIDLHYQKYYAAWTDSRQRQLEGDLQRAWERDPVIFLEAKVTRKLRGE